ncbi:hypothetical protein ACUXST_001232 [Sphingomonas sp. F9_3S_D5_B_2]
MRRIALAAILLVAGCAAPQGQPQTSVAPPPVVQAPQPREQGAVIGMTAAELVAHFGSPALQVREGASLKLQFRRPNCVLDVYLYPSGGGAQRATHIDARLPSGLDTNPQTCVAQMDRGS